MSKYEFGVAIARQFGFDENLVHPGLSNGRRIDSSTLTQPDTFHDKLAAALGHPLPEFSQGLVKFHDQYRHGFPELIKSLA